MGLLPKLVISCNEAADALGAIRIELVIAVTIAAAHEINLLLIVFMEFFSGWINFKKLTL